MGETACFAALLGGLKDQWGGRLLIKGFSELPSPCPTGWLHPRAGSEPKPFPPRVMCFPPDWLQGPGLLLTSSWAQSPSPWGSGQGQELLAPCQSCMVITSSTLPCSAYPGQRLPPEEEEPLAKSFQTSCALAHFSPSLLPWQQWEGCGLVAPPCPRTPGSSVVSRPHMVQLSLTSAPSSLLSPPSALCPSHLASCYSPIRPISFLPQVLEYHFLAV